MPLSEHAEISDLCKSMARLFSVTDFGQTPLSRTG